MYLPLRQPSAAKQSSSRITPRGILGRSHLRFCVPQSPQQNLELRTGRRLRCERRLSREAWPVEADRDLTPGGLADEATFSDATWADDSSFVTMAEDCECLERQTTQLAETVFNACERHGLQPNTKPDKTVVVTAMRGRGKQHVLKQLFPNSSRTMEIELVDGRRQKLHVQAQYKHLGGILEREGSLQAEARRRLAIAASSFEQHRARILQNTFLDEPTRSTMFRGLVTATFFNLEIWTSGLDAWKTMVAGYHRLLRRVLCKGMDSHVLYRMVPRS